MESDLCYEHYFHQPKSKLYYPVVKTVLSKSCLRWSGYYPFMICNNRDLSVYHYVGHWGKHEAISTPQ